jgi:hypothetical protein
VRSAARAWEPPPNTHVREAATNYAYVAIRARVVLATAIALDNWRVELLVASDQDNDLKC